MSKITRGYAPVKGLKAKLHNRRINAWLMYDGTVEYHFRTLDHGKIRGQKIRLSPQAIITIFQLALDLGALKEQIT